MSARLDSRLDFVLGARTGGMLSRALHLGTVEDLLRHYPRRYAERGRLTDLTSLGIDEHVTVMARVVRADVFDFADRSRPGKLRKRIEVVVTDGRGELLLTFFSQLHLLKVLRPGVVGLFGGQVGVFRHRRQLLHPDFEILDAEAGQDLETVSHFTRPLIPVYPATTKLSSWRIARCVEVVLDEVETFEDPLPGSVLEPRELLGLAAALEKVHRPASREDAAAARSRLRFEEAFVLQAALALRRRELESTAARPRPERPNGLRERFDARLPFELTAGQVRIGAQLSVELARPHPMHRLLQGEVGSGKTVIALRAMLQVVDAGGQAALLAPTEVLASQHHRSVSAMLGELALAGMLGGADDATRVCLITGSVTGRARREALSDVESGAAGIVIGTHALLEEHVRFHDLGLVVVDEQHRFGVEQRAALAAKAGATRPHVLVMTATPIPRTVAMTVFGDLETSTLRELPSGRHPVETVVVPEAERPAWLERGWQRVAEEVAQGRQAYVVCVRIGGEESPDSDPMLNRTRAATEVYAELEAGPLRGLRVGLLHGRLPAEVKDEVASAFDAGRIDVLVATTVVEVGVDVPNASVMVVMDAERFGVSQLHQLRGRVGRGAAAGLCLLVTAAPTGTPARTRLDAVAATTDGFELSRLDLELRHEGDVLGATQSGRRSSLRLLSVIDDEDVIADARAAATATITGDPRLDGHPALATALRHLEDRDQAGFLDKA